MSLGASHMRASLGTGGVQINLEVRSHDSPDWLEGAIIDGSIVND